MRGNLDTRLKKLDGGRYDAILLAVAGLNRLGWADRITEKIPPEILLPAMGQGALGIETRLNDTDVHKYISFLDKVFFGNFLGIKLIISDNFLEKINLKGLTS